MGDLKPAWGGGDWQSGRKSQRRWEEEEGMSQKWRRARGRTCGALEQEGRTEKTLQSKPQGRGSSRKDGEGGQWQPGLPGLQTTLPIKYFQPNLRKKINESALIFNISISLSCITTPFCLTFSFSPCESFLLLLLQSHLISIPPTPYISSFVSSFLHWQLLNATWSMEFLVATPLLLWDQVGMPGPLDHHRCFLRLLTFLPLASPFLWPSCPRQQRLL